jgi:hypothetical protein
VLRGVLNASEATRTQKVMGSGKYLYRSAASPEQGTRRLYWQLHLFSRCRRGPAHPMHRSHDDFHLPNLTSLTLERSLPEMIPLLHCSPVNFESDSFLPGAFRNTSIISLLFTRLLSRQGQLPQFPTRPARARDSNPQLFFHLTLPTHPLHLCTSSLSKILCTSCHSLANSSFPAIRCTNEWQARHNHATLFSRCSSCHPRFSTFACTALGIKWW